MLNHFNCAGCEAHVENDAEFASGIYNSEWKFVNPEENADETWVYATAHVVSRVVDEETVLDNIYQSLRYQRSVKYIPKGQDYFTLRNKLPMPKMGLGTGGLYPGDETHDVIKEAMKLGYRSFDLAREYGNEHVIAQVLQETKDDPEMPKREDLFLETKVWPTELGFYPTSIAIEKSLEELQSNYVDLYMLHWPRLVCHAMPRQPLLGYFALDVAALAVTCVCQLTSSRARIANFALPTICF